MSKNEFGLAVRRKRRQLEMTQEELAERAKMSNTSISRIEGGQQNPTRDTMLVLCEVLEMELTTKDLEDGN